MSFNQRSEWLTLNEARMADRSHWYIYSSGMVSCCVTGGRSDYYTFYFEPNNWNAVADSLCAYLYELGIDYDVEILIATKDSSKYKISELSRKVTLDDVLSLRKKGRLTE